MTRVVEKLRTYQEVGGGPLHEVTAPAFNPSQRVLAKLKHYGTDSPDQPVSISLQQTLEEISKGEPGATDRCSSLLNDLRGFEVVVPNWFLTESREGTTIAVTHDLRRGIAAARAAGLANDATRAVLTSDDSKLEAFSTGGIAEHNAAYVAASLAGPFPALLDLSSDRPLMSLVDFSYTGTQLFRAFAGVYCDFTPILKVSRLDFLEFSVHHEIGHKKTEEIIRDGKVNEIFPGLQFGIDGTSMSSKNLIESIADVYGALKHIQRSGSDELPQQIMAMRMLATFSPCYQNFETTFTLNVGGSTRRRIMTEYCTCPALAEGIKQGMALFERGRLSGMDDDALVALSVQIAREFKLSETALQELSALSTTINWNVMPRDFSWTQLPESKRAISPYAVQLALRAVSENGTFSPRGGDSIERIFSATQSSESARPFHKGEHSISDELRAVIDRYGDALAYLETQGIRPRTTEYYDHVAKELVATISCAVNQTPNATVYREVEDCRASYDKYPAPFSGRWDMVGMRAILRAVPWGDDSYDYQRRYVKFSSTTADPFETVTGWFANS